MNTTETIPNGRGSLLRRNGSESLQLDILQEKGFNFYMLNGNNILKFEETEVAKITTIIDPEKYYMIVNTGKSALTIEFSQDPSSHQKIYDPYKFEKSDKVIVDSEQLKKIFEIPEGYKDTLPKWYSFKFTYEKYNIIFIRPELGISWQRHEKRNEFWEILGGNPIIIIDNKVHFYVKEREKLENPMGTLHAIINPNKENDKWVIIKESWSGEFDESDIERIFNPNHYF